jgi:hypothetical protein
LPEHNWLAPLKKVGCSIAYNVWRGFPKRRAWELGQRHEHGGKDRSGTNINYYRAEDETHGH